MSMSISIRVVLIVMMVLLAIISCTIIGVLIFQAGAESANQASNLLRQETVRRKQLEIGGYFFQPLSVIRSLHAASKIPNTFDINVWDGFHIWLCSMTRLNDGRITYVGTELGYLSAASINPDGLTCKVEQYDAPSKLTPPNGTYRVIEYSYTAKGTPYLTQPWTVLGPSPSSYDPRVRPWYNVSHNTMDWSPVYLNHPPTAAVITPTAPLVDPLLDRNVGVFASDFTTVYVLEYLSNNVVAKTGKMILVDTVDRNVLGATWNESAVVYETHTNCGDFLNETCEKSKMATLHDFKEPMMRDAVDSLGIDYLYQCNDETDSSKPTACKTSFGKGRGRIFVDIAGIEDPYGLNLRLIVMIPERDFMEEVWKRGDLAAVIASIVVAVLIAISVVIVYFVLKPLKRVEERLYQAATLNSHKEEDDEPSLFAEVANIQQAYSKMAANLALIRSYVPQSLLQTIDGKEQDDDGESAHDVSESNQTPSNQSSHSVSHEVSSSGAMTGASRSSRHHNNTFNQQATTVGLQRRRVTVLAINLSNFHKDSTILTNAKLIETHAATLTTIQHIVTANRGVLDSFSGDRFTITFNAVTNCASHMTRAAACIAQISAKIPTANFGAATGLALCGNMGNSEVRRFTIVGPVVNQAYVLERMCRILNVKSLVSYQCYETMQFEYHLEAVDVVQLPFSVDVVPILRVVGAKEGVDTEWMYALQSANEVHNGGFVELNEAYVQYARGDTESAHSAIKENLLNDQLLGTRNLKTMIHTPANEWKKRLGVFYTKAFHGDEETPTIDVA